MNCETVQRELSTGADTPALRAHVQECSACRSWALDMEQLDHRLAAWRADEPPAAIESRLRASLSAPAPEPTLSRLARSLKRLKEMPKMQKRAALAATVTVAFAAVLAISSTRSSAHTLLTRVQDAMKRVRTAHALLTAFPNGKPVRHGEMWFSEGRWRMETAGQPAQVFADGKTWSYDAETKELKSSGDVPEHFKRVAEGGFTAHTLLHELAATHGNAAPVHMGSETVNGRTIDRYIIPQADEDEIATRAVMHVDHATLLPVRFEKQVKTAAGWTTGMSVEFDFNRPIEKRLLDPQALVPAR